MGANGGEARRIGLDPGKPNGGKWGQMGKGGEKFFVDSRDLEKFGVEEKIFMFIFEVQKFLTKIFFGQVGYQCVSPSVEMPKMQ